MDIRKATLKDSLLLSTLCMDVQLLHAEHHPGFFKEPQSPDFATSFFEKVLSEEAAFVFIAEENGNSLGYIFCNLVERPENPFIFARRFLMIEQIAVQPQAQGRGVGASLMEQAEVTARELGAERIELGSWDFNTNAHGFFERIGYQKHHIKFWKVLN